MSLRNILTFTLGLALLGVVQSRAGAAPSTQKKHDADNGRKPAAAAPIDLAKRTDDAKKDDENKDKKIALTSDWAMAPMKKDAKHQKNALQMVVDRTTKDKSKKKEDQSRTLASTAPSATQLAGTIQSFRPNQYGAMHDGRRHCRRTDMRLATA
jgi:hypothetical protein